MIRMLFLLYFISISIQIVSISFLLPLAVRYKFSELWFGVLYFAANTISELTRLFSVIESGVFGYIRPSVVVIISLVYLIVITIMTFVLPRIIHGYLSLPFPAWIYCFVLIQPLIFVCSLHFVKGPFFYRCIIGIVYVAIPYMISNLYGTVLMAWGLLRKNVYQRNFLVIGTVLNIVYIPFGFVDCFWPLFPRFYAVKPSGLGLSTISAMLLGFFIIRYSYRYLIEMGSSSKEYTYSGAGKFRFTEREEEVLHFVVEGYKNDQIAAHLRISSSTVKKHLYNMFQKTGSENRIDLLNSCRNNI